MKDCQFCQFAKGEGSFHKIYEDQDHLAGIFEADELATVIFTKKHFDKSYQMPNVELIKFTKFSRLVEIMIMRAYPDLEYVDSRYNCMITNHYHEMRTPKRRARADKRNKNLPKTAAGIAQRIKNWAPVEFRHPENPVKYSLPEWIKEIITDGSLVAGNSNPLIIEMVQKLYLDEKTPTQKEIDQIIDQPR